MKMNILDILQFEELEHSFSKKSACRIKRDQASLIYKTKNKGKISNTYMINFGSQKNESLSEFKHVAIARDSKNRLFFVFNNLEKGVRITENRYKNYPSSFVLNSKSFVERVMEILNIEKNGNQRVILTMNEFVEGAWEVKL